VPVRRHLSRVSSVWHAAPSQWPILPGFRKISPQFRPHFRTSSGGHAQFGAADPECAIQQANEPEGRIKMRLTSLIVVLFIGTSASAAPPPDSNGTFREWFQSLRVPNVSNGAICCTVADCRMVASRWNDRTRHHEAEVVREVFANALQNSSRYNNDNETYLAARGIWIQNWIARFGDASAVWIEIPDERVNLVDNPTGRSVLCFSTFHSAFNGVFCFVPFDSVLNELADGASAFG
jgi:hypothetical protein